MNKKKVGIVTETEKFEIQKLYERKLALNEMIPTLNSLSDEQKNELYEKIIQDLGKTENNFQLWWYEKGVKYNWESSENGNWVIDFNNGEIFLVMHA